MDKYFLECVFGDCRGEKFELHRGVNKVGRGYLMDVCISEDIQLTRDNHCSIIWDEQDVVKLVPSNGAITYYNNTLLKEIVELKENDVIRVGRNELAFRIKL